MNKPKKLQHYSKKKKNSDLQDATEFRKQNIIPILFYSKLNHILFNFFKNKSYSIQLFINKTYFTQFFLKKSNFKIYKQDKNLILISKIQPPKPTYQPVSTQSNPQAKLLVFLGHFFLPKNNSRTRRNLSAQKI